MIKMQSREIVEIIQAGSFRMNSLKYYRELYNKTLDKIIGDPNEGKFIIHEATILIPEKGICTSIKDEPLPTSNEDDFVFCAFGIDSNTDTFKFNEEQKSKLFDTYDSTLLITDFDEFKARIIKAANRKGLKIEDAFVGYYDPSIDDMSRLVSLLKNGMESIVFHKTVDYAYQQEYRFTTRNFTGEDFLDLDIGNISDISEIFTTKEILNSLMIRAREEST